MSSLQGNRIQTILIADDVSLNRTLIRVMLRQYGYHFEEADNGKEALEKIRRSRPDLVLMDLMMPVMDGFQALKLLREETARDGFLPVIAITANDGKKEKADILSAGFDGCLGKPIIEEELLEVIRDAESPLSGGPDKV